MEQAENQLNCLSFNTRKMINSPFDLDTILESLFTHVNLTTLKTCRSLNSQWYLEGSRSLLQKSFLQIPPSYYTSPKKRQQIFKNLIQSLLTFTSSTHYPLPLPFLPTHLKLLINQSRDVATFFSIFPPSHLFWSLIRELKYGDDLEPSDNPDEDHAQLTSLLHCLPNLTSVSSRFYREAFNDPYDWNFDYIQPFLKSNRAHLVRLYNFALDFIPPIDLEPLENLEYFSRFDTKLVELNLSVYMGSNSHNWMANSVSLWSRLGQALTKIFQCSASTLEELHLCHNMGLLTQFHCCPLTKLDSLYLYLDSGKSKELRGFQFKLNFPNLRSVTMQVDGIEEDQIPNFCDTVFPNVGPAESVKELEIYSSHVEMHKIVKIFPNVESLCLVNVLEFQTMARVIWGQYRQLKNLKFNLVVNYPTICSHFIDAALTGFSVENIKRIESGNFKFEELQQLQRQFPSLLQLTELNHLSIEFNCSRLVDMPLSYKLISKISGQFAFKPLAPKLKVQLSIYVSMNTQLRQELLETLRPLTEFCEIK